MLQPRQRRFIYAASFVYGLTIVDGQSFISPSVGLQFFALLANRAFGRDLLLVNSCLLAIGLVLARIGWIPQLEAGLFHLYVGVTALTIFAALFAIVKTKRVLTHWKPVLAACTFLTIATSTYFTVPILSMTNPPVNWANTRTVEGFLHALTRGQFEKFHLFDGPSIVDQLAVVAKIAIDDLGWLNLFFAVIPLVFSRHFSGRLRTFLIALVVILITTTLLLIAVLNPNLDRQSVAMIRIYFAPAYIIVALFAACGLAIVAAMATKPKTTPVSRHVCN